MNDPSAIVIFQISVRIPRRYPTAIRIVISRKVVVIVGVTVRARSLMWGDVGTVSSNMSPDPIGIRLRESQKNEGSG